MEPSPPPPPPDLPPQPIVAVREDRSSGRLLLAGLSPEQIAAIRAADIRAKKIRRAAKFAASEGTLSMIVGLSSLACFMFGWINAVLGILLGIFAYNTIRGANMLKRFDRAAVPLLAWNEVFLIAIVTLYSAYSIYSGLSTGGDPLTSKIISPEDIQLLNIDPKLIRESIWAFYLSLIALTALSQGLVGYYYKTREKHLEAYLQETPQWIVDFQKAQSA